MYRRHFLHLASAASVAVTVAGCLGRAQTGTGSSSASVDSDTGDADATGPDATELTDDLPDPPFRGMRAEPAATYLVGAQTGTAAATPGAHVVQVWNDGETAREVTVVITGRETGVQFDETVELPPGDHLDFRFETPDAYTVEVSGTGFSTQASVDRDWDECSTSMTTVRLSEGGVESRSTSQSGDCESATTASSA